MIEDLIKQLIASTDAQTAATKENTETLKLAIAVSGRTVPSEAPAPAKPRGAKKTTEPAPAAAAEETPLPVEEAPAIADEEAQSPAVTEEQPSEETPADADEEDRIINEEEAAEVRQAVRDGAVRSKAIADHTAAFGELRKEFGVEKITQLRKSQHAEFINRLKAL